MENMKEIQMRMKSIEDTMKITNAMYLISSSKLKKAKKNFQQTIPYFEQLQSSISSILLHSPDIEHRYFGREEDKTEEKRKGFILITGDKGLCGSYNHNVLRLADKVLSANGSDTIFTVGQAGAKYFERKNVEIDGEFLYVAQNPSLHWSGSIAEAALNLYDNNMLDEVYIIYTKMTSSITSEPRLIKVLPLEKYHFNALKHEKIKRIVTYSPSVEIVLDHLVPNYLKGLIFGALTESFSSEQNARMMAMDSATKNARDMLSTLSLAYNRARQAAITQEITEIVGGSMQ